jgi:hypothetical protein
MFKRSFRSHHQQDPNTRVDKAARLKKATGSGPAPAVGAGAKDARSRVHRSASRAPTPARDSSRDVRDRPAASSRDARDSRETREREGREARQSPASPQAKPLSPSPIVTLTVGKEGRIFAAHEDVLCQAPFFESACRGHPKNFKNVVSSGGNQLKRLHLPEEEPEVFSAVLEYLYKGDYYPRLLPGKNRDSWELEDGVRGGLATASPLLSEPATPKINNNNNNNNNNNSASSSPNPAASRPEATVYISDLDQHILRDTAVYCAAERFGLDELKRLSLRKQGLQSGIDVATILRSAQFAYANTPDSDSRLRAHYLALIIRCRRTFKRSGTLQTEMERGGSKLYFDLFVAMCNHLDDVIDVSNSRSPKVV